MSRRTRTPATIACLPIVCLALAAGCGPGSEEEPPWEIVERDLPGALISVWGTSGSDIWVVGGDAGEGDGPEVRHFDGTDWTRLVTGETGDLWWVYGFGDGPIYTGGAGGMILVYEDGAFTRMTTPGTQTIFGIWGASPDDVWAVGGQEGGASGAFAWRLQDGAWAPEPTFPAELEATDAIWKVFGRSANDVWLVGTNGTVVRWDGASMTADSTNVGESLFTVHADSRAFYAVGGFGSGIILENDGDGWLNVSPTDALGLVGVCVTEDTGYAVGQFGEIRRRTDEGWVREGEDLLLDESLHAVWIEPGGGAWAVGGRVLAFPLIQGVLLHKEGR
jgi:hypothetical protein